MKKLSAVLCIVCIILLLSFALTACDGETQYGLTVNGSENLFESLNKTYKAGEEVTVKVKIKPYEGVNAMLDNEPLVKTKSTQNEYWQFTFEMPAHDATLDISSYKGFDEPLLFGVYLNFCDKDGNPIEEFNKPVESKDAVADYVIVYFDEELNGTVISSNEGANVFADGKGMIGDNRIESENTLYYTYELMDAVALVNWVYFDEETQQIFTCDSAGFKLNGIGIGSTFNNQNLSDIRFNSQMREYEKEFNSSIKISFAYLDYLTGVKVLEYDVNNNIIKSTEVVKSESEQTHTVSESCEYVVIEEEYTVKNDEAHNGEKYYERTLINKSALGGGKVLKYPRGNGLIMRVYLSIDWQNEADE